MIWCLRALTRRAVSGHWILNLPDELMHHLDETLGDEFEREFWQAMSEPLDGES